MCLRVVLETPLCRIPDPFGERSRVLCTDKLVHFRSDLFGSLLIREHNDNVLGHHSVIFGRIVVSCELQLNVVLQLLDVGCFHVDVAKTRHGVRCYQEGLRRDM